VEPGSIHNKECGAKAGILEFTSALGQIKKVAVGARVRGKTECFNKECGTRNGRIELTAKVFFNPYYIVGVLRSSFRSLLGAKLFVGIDSIKAI